MFRRNQTIPLLGLLTAFGGGLAFAQPAEPAGMVLGAAAPAPVGYVEFCRREPAECPGGGARPQGEFDPGYWSLAFQSHTGGRLRRADARAATPAGPIPPVTSPSPQGRRIVFTQAVFADLERVNRDVNARIIATPDRAHDRRRDHWDLPLSRGDRRGDCEDYVLEKRRELVRLGYPSEALSIALARTRRNESHAVLIVETTNGALVLDSFSPWVAPWSTLAYRWLVRQNPDDPTTWVEVLG